MDEVEGVPPVAAENGAAQPTAAAPTRAPRRRRRPVIVVSTAVAATLAVGSAFGLGALTYTAGSASTTASTASSSVHNTLSRNGFGAGGYSYGYGSGGSGGYGGSGSGSSSSAGSSTLASATAAEEVGVVDITSQLTYAQAESAGTGLVLTSNGEILTNNHVVEGATSISVTVVATGAQYTAKVVGTDTTDDIAVLQLSNASGLSTANLDTSADVAVGDAVTGVGNAGGTGGTPSASPGSVTALDQTITTQAEQTAVSETLSGLIQTDADIQAGDSGGPLFNSADQVIGIDTAAAQGGATEGYAIPIQNALTIAGEITSGQASSTVTIGYPAFLGVEVAPSDSVAAGSVAGATISGVVSGGPAESAGLAAGDTITAVNGTTIDSAQALTTALAALHPGDSASVSWTDASGASHTAQVTLAQGPVA
ncbi:S1C family serine protease [Leifsonia sp. P73]|uniref:S1C family serine protease n=1 Tax=Leifsonia sp. P73 TaxID=3423959 RepID=UPI003DA34F81